MATAPTARLLTADEFYDFCSRPENAGRHFELERGEVVEVSRPGVRHCAVCANVSRLLGNYAFAQGGGLVCGNDAGVVWEKSPDTVLGPDVSWFRESFEYDELPPKYAETPPTLAVEVFSPTDRPNKVARRINQFLRCGTKVVWLLDPEDRTLAVHRAGELTATLEEADDLDGGGELPGFRCRVGDFFAVPRKPPAASPA